MDLWDALGISRQAGLGAAAVGLVAALAMAGRLFLRSSRPDRSKGLGLQDR